MSTYVKITDYAAKDALLTGNPSKLIKGTELGAEFDSIATADASNVKTATLALSTGTTLVGHVMSGSNATTRTVQAKLREFPNVSDYTAIADYITAAFSGQHYVQNGARVHRFTDRVLIGRAAENDGKFPCVSQDWMTEYQIAAGLSSGTMMAAVGGILNDAVAGSAVGWISGSQSLDFTSAGASCIGGMDFALNNNTTYATNAWARYGEAHMEATSTGTAIYGTEYNVRAMKATTTPHPWQQGTAVGHQIAAGAGLSATGQYDASCAAQIVANPMKWKVGINFMSDSLVGTDGTLAGTSSIATAVAMANYQAIKWHKSDGTAMSSIYSSCITKAAGMLFNDSVGVVFTGDAGQPLFGVSNVTSAVNYLIATPNISGSAVQLASTTSGADAGVDIWINTYGTGVVRFGTHTGSGDVACNGYITIKDDAGTTRKLMTTA